MLDFYKANDKALEKEAHALIPRFMSIYRAYGIDVLMRSIHEGVDKALERSGLWEQASCKGACSFCCHDTILMSPIEAKYVKNMLKGSGIKGNKKRIKLQSTGGNLTFMDKACPYLADENEEGNRLCSIYEIRPLVCRAHNSTEPIEFCNKELYPGRSIQEGRIVQVEAVQLALMMMQGILFNQVEPDMVAIHKLK